MKCGVMTHNKIESYQSVSEGDQQVGLQQYLMISPNLTDTPLHPQQEMTASLSLIFDSAAGCRGSYAGFEDDVCCY